MTNKSNMRTWVDALRSDKYKDRQGTGYLSPIHLKSGLPLFCCLGVCHNLIDPDRWVEHVCDERTVMAWPEENENEAFSLTREAHEWLGWPFGDEDGDMLPEPKVWVPDDGRIALATLNDGNFERERLTFAEIADLLEAEFLTPFGA